jgi:hypothetical protein
MDHVVYLDAKAKELDLLTAGKKSMLIRGATGRKIPYGRVNEGDVLYFINNNAEGQVRAKAVVTKVFNSEKMTPEESTQLVESNQSRLNLSPQQFKKWAGKRYLVLIEVGQFEELSPFEIDKSDYGNMDDWLPVEEIGTVRLDGTRSPDPSR